MQLFLQQIKSEIATIDASVVEAQGCMIKVHTWIHLTKLKLQKKELPVSIPNLKMQLPKLKESK